MNKIRPFSNPMQCRSEEMVEKLEQYIEKSRVLKLETRLSIYNQLASCCFVANTKCPGRASKVSAFSGVSSCL